MHETAVLMRYFRWCVNYLAAEGWCDLFPSAESSRLWEEWQAADFQPRRRLGDWIKQRANDPFKPPST